MKHTVGMTGEVTLQGRVLPIGGLKQKVLAAHAAGLTEVIIPERNRHDLDDVPADVREALTFHPVMSVGEVLELALEPARRRTVRCRPCNPVPEEVRRAADLLERRWTLSILYASIEGAERFNEFLDALGSRPPGDAGRAAERARRGGPPRPDGARHAPAGGRVPADRRGQAPRAVRARARPLVPRLARHGDDHTTVAASGNRTETVVPPVAADWIAKSPPSSAVRSRIEVSPTPDMPVVREAAAVVLDLEAKRAVHGDHHRRRSGRPRGARRS